MPEGDVQEGQLVVAVLRVFGATKHIDLADHRLFPPVFLLFV